MMLSQGHIEIIKRYFAGVPVRKAYLFGSYSRNEAKQGSDIDILIELDHSQPIGMQFFTFQYELEDRLHMKVDLVSSEGISHYIRPLIDKEKILIYDRSAH